MTKETLKKVMGAFAEAVRDHVKAKIDSRMAALNTRLDKIESAERRLSRHADHLARIESRLKNLEGER